MDKELKNSVQFIADKVGKKPSFTTPQDYFDTFEDGFLNRLTEEKLPKNSGFKTPETYFDDLEDTVLLKVLVQKKETKVISLKHRILKVIPFAAAASILLFIGLNSFVFNTDKQITIDAISDVEIENWMNTNNIHYNDVALVLQEDILNDNEFSLANIKNETIEDYIISTDNTSLLNEGY